MDLREAAAAQVQQRVQELRQKQYNDGSWRFCFEGAIMTDCWMLLLLRALRMEDERLTDLLTARIAGLQVANGAWKLHEDEADGNLSATIQAYTALLSSGRFQQSDANMQRAAAFIREKGGLGEAHFMTKFMLAVHGQYAYPHLFYVPAALFLLPSYAPLNIYEFSNYARIHLTPMIICMNKKFTVADVPFPDLSHLHVRGETSWFTGQRSSLLEAILKEGRRLAAYPRAVQQRGYKAAEQFMLQRIEANGTLYSYASSTFYMIYALLALGYETVSPVIQRAVKGLRSMLYETNRGWHLQNSPSTVWDTALLSYALQEAGVSADDPMIAAASRYLAGKQHTKQGDWAVHAPHVPPGGWGFSEVNERVPDHDDTSAALRALTRTAAVDDRFRERWQRGFRWLLGMQNNDGGWGAFEKDANREWLTCLPLANAEDAIIDASTADLTGRVLEFLGGYAGLKADHSAVSRAVSWLQRHQEPDGSWYGRWGVCYIYGTWAALTGLQAVRAERDESIQKAVRWLESIQNPDGGWGESCSSSVQKRFVPLSFSTPSQTAWAVDALLSVQKRETPAIRRGILYLLQQQDLKRHVLEYPTGLGLPGGFYIQYHSYNELFPLLALAHYMKCKNKQEGR
ncbi:squalene--hopene cyclase [Ectobacillus ponti]|uniref:Squalene--hopene cyclase n=1 Tax=Ectobacillus ponti TaxID=2961894 RepID=A0AA41X9H2_9BACI|nr:squalene--hopene cyclase [Ectobacillus ponti]MCP8969169.1 squalene--hopene cyclase [Ectobacillus ponti]